MPKKLHALLLILSVTLLGACAAVSHADEETDASLSEVDAKNAKQKVLDWFDDFAEKQVLFHEDDVERLRKELTDDTPEEAIKWWQDTAKIRAALDSPEWQDTREWLREFLRVQAIYSDDQIDELRTETKVAANKESPRDFKEILLDIERRRAHLAQGAAGSKSLRNQQVKVAEAFQKEQAAARAAATKAAAAAAASAPRNSGQQVVQRRSRQGPPPPLVNSLDAARWGVMRGFWR